MSYLNYSHFLVISLLLIIVYIKAWKTVFSMRCVQLFEVFKLMQIFVFSRKGFCFEMFS